MCSNAPVALANDCARSNAGVRVISVGAINRIRLSFSITYLVPGTLYLPDYKPDFLSRPHAITPYLSSEGSDLCQLLGLLLSTPNDSRLTEALLI
ncbi:hypothetical protein EMIT0P253_70207 [Pseudomonas sp. IT-P253]